jgi:DNA-binding MarR family transcriptional regulator
MDLSGRNEAIVTDENIARLADSPAMPTDGSVAGRGAARVEQRRRQARELEHREPLSRRILEALAESPTLPRDLAGLVKAAPESVSRVLASLLEEGLVWVGEVEGDKRKRPYALTREGEVRLSRQRAFGAPADPPRPPTPAETLAFMHAAVRNAVRMRRETNGLEDAADRLRLVVEEAQRLQIHELELEAMAELVTTLRQERQIEAMDALLNTLQEISLGRHPNRGPALALPAAAHREYTLGRLPQMHGGGDPCVRARHLDAAQSLFGQLARSSSGSEQAACWETREAWSVISMANNLRERSKLEDALDATSWAMRLFDRLEDPYGRSRCLFMYGFCQRLMGDFDDAWLQLSEAYDLATAHSFQRFQADSLMQMGDVLRCQGEFARARSLLEEACDLSERMSLVVTQAFAQSALGAVAFEEERLGEAQAALRSADELFEACRHSEGHALNDRRRASVERHLEMSARRGQLKVARRFALRALERYQQLRSPAGMAACEIEIMRGGRVDRRVANLVERLEDTHQRNLLELDPWVPKIFLKFAQEMEDADLAERAQHLVAASERRLADWATQSVGSTSKRIGGLRQRLADRRFVAFEMGGEARSEEDAVCQTQAVA